MAAVKVFLLKNYFQTNNFPTSSFCFLGFGPLLAPPVLPSLRLKNKIKIVNTDAPDCWAKITQVKSTDTPLSKCGHDGYNGSVLSPLPEGRK